MNLPQAWQLFLLAKTYDCRPSELAGIEDPYQAYCFDEAVGRIGTHISNELSSAGVKPSKESRNAERAQRGVLSKYFGEELDKTSFRAPEKALSRSEYEAKMQRRRR